MHKCSVTKPRVVPWQQDVHDFPKSYSMEVDHVVVTWGGVQEVRNGGVDRASRVSPIYAMVEQSKAVWAVWL